MEAGKKSNQLKEKRGGEEKEFREPAQKEMCRWKDTAQEQ